MQSDDRKFFEELFREHENVLYRLFVWVCYDTNVARDLVHETFIELWKQRDKFVKGTNFKAWACAVARNKWRAFKKKRDRDRHYFTDELEDLLIEDGFARGEVFEEERIALDHCLKTLGDDEERLIRGHYWDDLKVKDLAKLAECSDGALRHRLSRIREKLFCCIEDRMRGS